MGYHTVAERFETRIRELGGRLRVVPGDLHAYRVGDAGRAADQPAFLLPDGTVG